MLLVETTGAFSLLGPNGVDVKRLRPTVIERSSFVEVQCANGQLRVLAELPDEATDAEFAKFWEESEGDEELAIESFKATFTTVEKPSKATRKPKAR
jgi:hypothetical protein